MIERGNNRMKIENQIKCKNCEKIFVYENKGDVFPGGKDKEEVVCPYCGKVNMHIMTSGTVVTHKLLETDFEE